MSVGLSEIVELGLAQKVLGDLRTGLSRQLFPTSTDDSSLWKLGEEELTGNSGEVGGVD